MNSNDRAFLLREELEIKPLEMSLETIKPVPPAIPMISKAQHDEIPAAKRPFPSVGIFSGDRDLKRMKGIVAGPLLGNATKLSQLPRKFVNL
jgi:hypothetical protein